MRRPLVEFLTRRDCPLCEEAEGWLGSWADRLGLVVERRDVDQEPALAEEYGAVVPVLRTPEGTVIAEGRWSRYRTFVSLLSYRLAVARRDLGPSPPH